MRFGIRVAVLVSVSSLFATNQWPQGLWVTVSTLMVCWFPAMDAASVVQKSWQRLVGTLMGGCLALLVGSLSRIIHPDQVERREVFLHAAYATVCFTVTYLSLKIKVSRTASIVHRYNYGTVLCLLTFTITIFPFLEQKDPWKKAVWRIINVTMGIGIASIGSMLILPRSTKSMLLHKIQKQCVWAGQSSEAVLHAAASDVVVKDVPSPFQLPPSRYSSHLSSDDNGLHGLDNLSSQQDARFGTSVWESIRVSIFHRSFDRLHEDLLEEGEATTLDVVLEKYDAAIRDWKDTKALFLLFRYDPFHWIVPSSAEFRNDCHTLLAKALRVQTTVVLLDGIIRNDSDTMAFLEADQRDVLAEMGTLIRKMLSVPRQQTPTSSGEESESENNNLLLHPVVYTAGVATATNPLSSVNDVSKERLLFQLQCFRESVDQLARNILMQTEKNEAKSRSGSRHFSLLFLQLVEPFGASINIAYDSWVVMETFLSEEDEKR